MIIVLWAIFLVCIVWIFHCINVTLEERLRIIDYVYSTQGSDVMIWEYEATIPEQHLWYRLTFRKPPYLDRLTGVQK